MVRNSHRSRQMKSLTHFDLYVVLALTVLSQGCVCTTPGSQNDVTLNKTRALEVVVRAVGAELGNDTICQLDLSDGDLAYIERRFQDDPPTFRYRRFRADATASDPSACVLSIRQAKISSQKATFRMTCRTPGAFADTLYQLELKGNEWRIVGCVPVCES